MTNIQHNFDGLGIAPRILDVLDKLQYSIPTPIQTQSIPHALEGKDIMGIAQTGTGKTLAFGIPTLQRLAQLKGIALIILPTRELAVQVNEELKKIGSFFHLRTSVLIGGENIGRQIKSLRQKPHIIIATPGRLIDHLEQKTVSLNEVKTLVLDEADRMLDMGFAPQIKNILKHVPRERQTMLFSATMPPEIVKLATSYMKLPVRVEVAPAGTAAANVTHEIFFVSQSAKVELLKSLLTEYKGSALIFSRTKHGAKKIAAGLRAAGHSTTELHSNRTLNQRLASLNGFKSGMFRVLVATDIAARGIDVKNIELVINFDLPEKPEDYIHRIGRTGRAGHDGHAISFATPAQKRDISAIERLMKKNLPVSKLPAGITSAAPDPNFADNRPKRGFNKYQARQAGNQNNSANRSSRPNRFSGQSEKRSNGRFRKSSVSRPAGRGFRQRGARPGSFGGSRQNRQSRSR
ncbi:MAG: DEAD/DEAH box helicase [bacterium]|nr:DEAD/DEAH box helicase [bacterium]